MARKNDSSSGMLFKTGIFAVLAGLAYWIFSQFSGGSSVGTPPINPAEPTPQEASTPKNSQSTTKPMVPDEILPTASTDGIVRHNWFTLSYNEAHEQAEWVAYEINKTRLNDNWAERPNTFRPDPDIRTESATPRDYSGSGYDKGHLCAAADMAFDAVAIDETFMMSNISPQLRAFNAGIWRELEELCRDWGRKFGQVYVVTGPVLTLEPKGQIGFSKVSVPASFYKVVVAPKQRLAIGFIIPNEMSTRPVMDFACTIDRVEAVTAIDFFPKYLKGLDEELETSLDKAAWPVNTQRYEKRLKEWNN
jgi:endonuclease G, mitochondrial